MHSLCFGYACQGAFEAQGTSDNGECAIQSVFGTMDYVGQYFCKDARQFSFDSVGNSYVEFHSKLSGSSFMRWERNVWLDMVRLCVDADFNVSRLDVAVDNEVKMMCSALARDQVARQQIMQMHQQCLRMRKAFDAARAGLARRFGACCRRGSQKVLSFLCLLS